MVRQIVIMIMILLLLLLITIIIKKILISIIRLKRNLWVSHRVALGSRYPCRHHLSLGLR